MSDVYSSEKRSWVMSRIRGKSTSPEVKVRSLTHRLGYRFRLHGKELPGKPDLVFHSRKKVIFVHGCFWHGHDCPRGSRHPKSNAEYWHAKIRSNVERDARIQGELSSLGWNVMVVWECQLRDLDEVARNINKFLSA